MSTSSSIIKAVRNSKLREELGKIEAARTNELIDYLDDLMICQRVVSDILAERLDKSCTCLEKEEWPF